MFVEVSVLVRNRSKVGHSNARIAFAMPPHVENEYHDGDAW